MGDVLVFMEGYYGSLGERGLHGLSEILEKKDTSLTYGFIKLMGPINLLLMGTGSVLSFSSLPQPCSRKGSTLHSMSHHCQLGEVLSGISVSGGEEVFWLLEPHR